MPLVSVLIPTRNAEPFIGTTLQSILAQQVELEIIVIDDGSSDRSVAIAQEFNDPRIRIIPGPQLGIAAAFNAGLAAANGEYIARCDADDLYPPGRLAWQVQFLDSNDEFGAVCGFYSTITASGEAVADAHLNEPAGEMTDELLAGRGRSHMCAYVFRADVLRKIGGCREWFVTSEDRDLQYRLAEVTRIWFEPKPTYTYRLHDQSITHTQKLAERAYYEQAAKHFQEQRQRDGSDDLQNGTPPAIVLDGNIPTPQSASVQIQNILLGLAWKQHAAGNKRQAVATGWRACKALPGQLRVWKSLLALMLK